MSACHGCGTELPPSNGPHPRKWCSERCRKQTAYAGTCVDCGAKTNGYDGPGKASERCLPCASKKSGAERKVWTREAIVAAIQEWASIYGEHPRVCDWNPTQAAWVGREPHPDYRADPERWPHQHTVMREFGQPGGWARAIHEAGFTPRKHGESDASRMFPARMAEALALVESGMTQRAVAERLGLHENTVHRYTRLARERSAA